MENYWFIWTEWDVHGNKCKDLYNMIKYLRAIWIYVKCSRNKFYRGKYARIQETTLGWCVARYSCCSIPIYTFRRLWPAALKMATIKE
jgi:hypothetical protein